MTTSVKQFQQVQALNGKFKRFGKVFTFCCYYFDGLLIDTGPSCARKEVTDFVEMVKPKAIVLTHHHEDHAGNAEWISTKWNIPVLMNDLTAKLLRETKTIPLYRKLIWGNEIPSVNGTILKDKLQTPNYELLVIPTPGHTPDHISLVEEKEHLLFAGDLYLGNKLLYGMRGESASQIIQSIDKVLHYPFETIFCGHTGIAKQGRSSILQKKEYLLSLKEEAKLLHKKGLSVDSITKKLLPNQTVIEIFSFGEMSPKHLIHSLLD